ncbi:MAG: class I SAM-dependent methyltransferase [Solirubrobacterales bacterium]|nr:class I SAM-dependent methyltransferase [Solirubrobacterales bacterium]
MSGVGFDAERELGELRAYLGDAFDEELLRGHEHALERELEEAPSEAELYRTSQVYLYDLTVFAMSATKRPYHAMLSRHVAPGARLLDWGCGIGADGLLLLEAGYDVHFADFANPSTEYLRWRLARRGFPDAPVYDLDRDTIGEDFACAYAFDVIEHVEDPFAFLRTMERHAERVLVNVLAPDPGETSLHHELPVRGLLRHAADRDLREYRLLHGRSHVVLYGRERSGALARASNRLRLLRPGR